VGIGVIFTSFRVALPLLLLILDHLRAYPLQTLRVGQGRAVELESAGACVVGRGRLASNAEVICPLHVFNVSLCMIIRNLFCLHFLSCRKRGMRPGGFGRAPCRGRSGEVRRPRSSCEEQSRCGLTHDGTRQYVQEFGCNVRGLNCNSGSIKARGRCVCQRAVLGGVEHESGLAGLGGHGGLVSGRRPAGGRAWRDPRESNWSGGLGRWTKESLLLPPVSGTCSSPDLLMNLTGSTGARFLTKKLSSHRSQRAKTSRVRFRLIF